MGSESFNFFVPPAPFDSLVLLVREKLDLFGRSLWCFVFCLLSLCTWKQNAGFRFFKLFSFLVNCGLAERNVGNSTFFFSVINSLNI